MKKNFGLSRQDIRLANAYENLKTQPHYVSRPRVPVKKSYVEGELQNYKIMKLNEKLNATHTAVTTDAQDYSSKWTEVVKALEVLKNAVDLTDFMAFDDFNKLYEDALVAIDAYCASINKTINDIDEFCLDVKSIMPDDTLV